MSRGWQSEQRLFWSIGRPLKYMGLTLDEWVVTLAGIIPGIIMINSGMARLGLISFLVGIILCYMFKKFKGVSEHFRLVSFLVALGVWQASKAYPMLKGKVIGK